MSIIIPTILWVAGNPVVLGYVAAATSMSVKVIAGTSLGLVIAHSVFSF